MTPYEQEELSPDGLTLVRWTINPQRMSHETWTPAFFDSATGAPILTLSDEGFDGRPIWRDGGGFRLDLRHYWRGATLEIAVDRAAGTFRIADGPPEPLADIDRRVEEAFQAREKAAQAAARAQPRAAPRQPARRGRRNRLLGLALLLVAAMALLYLVGR